MTTTSEAAIAPAQQASWGVREVVVAALITLVVSTILGSLMLTFLGADNNDSASLITVAFLQTTLWIGMVGSVPIVLRRHHVSAANDLGLRFRATDVPIGIALGIASQLVLVPVISWPWARALGRSTNQLREPACELARKADDPLGVILLFVITVIGAPLIEELFFRGFVQRGITSRSSRVVGVVATAAVFGTIHYQLLQLPALVTFGLVLGSCAAATGRLGLSIVTHAAFNATTVVTLVILSSSVDERCASVLGTLL